MPVRTSPACFLTLCLAGLLATPAQGQSIPSPYRFVNTRQEAGVFVGTTSAAKGRFGFGPAGGVNLGGRWGVDLSGPLGFEVAAGVISGTRDIINPAKVIGDMRIGEADQMVAMADARLRLTLTGDRTWHGLAPFFVAGGGLAFGFGGDSPLDAQLDSDDRFHFGTTFVGTLGSGVRLALTDRLALRGDALFSLWKIKTPPGFSESARGFSDVEESEWSSGRHLAVSLLYRY